MFETKTVNYRHFVRTRQWTHRKDGSILTGPLTTETGGLQPVDRWRTGVSNKAYRSQIKAHTNATTPFSGETRECKVKLGSTYRRHWNWFDFEEYVSSESVGWITPPSFSQLDPASMPLWLEEDANNQALKFLYKRIREHRNSFSGMIFLGEMRETLRMLKSPLKSLRDGMHDYLGTLEKRRRGVRPTNFAKRTDRLKSILSDTWLEYSFGWKPFIADLEDAHKAYQRLQERQYHSRISATGKQQVIINQDLNQLAGFGTVYIRRNAVRYYEATVRYTVGLRGLTYATEQERKHDELGITLKNFVPTAWELLPWSFLADYFVNIGELIDASVTSTSDVTWGCKTVRRSGKLFVSGQVDLAYLKEQNGDLLINAGGDPGTLECDWRTVNRGAISSIPFPNLQVGIPGRPTQWLNMAALAAKKLKLTPFY